MPLLTGSRLDPSTRRSLASHLGGRPHVLAWARTVDGHVIGLPGALIVETNGNWTSHPWHEIDRGTWDEATSLLSWTNTAGETGEAVLTNGAKFASLFNERVAASIVVRHRIELSEARYATVALRRDLGSPTEQAVWKVTPGPGVSLSDPELQEHVDAVIADFGIS